MGKDLLFVSLLLVSRWDDPGIAVQFVLKKTATHFKHRNSSADSSTFKEHFKALKALIA